MRIGNLLIKILVTVKEVTELGDTFAIEDSTIADQHKEYELNEWDKNALEEEVQLSEDHDEAEVVAVTIGPDRSEETIRMVLAKDADRAIRIWDDALNEVDLDVDTKADILASVLKEEAPNLVLTGVQSADGANGVFLAQRSGYE